MSDSSKATKPRKSRKPRPPTSPTPRPSSTVPPRIADTFWDSLRDLVIADYVAAQATGPLASPIIGDDFNPDAARAAMQSFESDLQAIRNDFAARGNGRPGSTESLSKFCDVATSALTRVDAWESRRTDARNLTVSYLDVARPSYHAEPLLRAFHANAVSLGVKAIPALPRSPVAIHDGIAWLGQLQLACSPPAEESGADTPSRNGSRKSRPPKESDDVPHRQTVTRLQMAALINMSSRGLEKHASKLPKPANKRANGQPYQYYWDEARPVLAAIAGREDLPERFPSDQFKG